MTKPLLLSLTFFVLFLFSATKMLGQQAGVQGVVLNEAEETLGFATIFIRNIKTGSTANIDGYYQINLKPGNYDLVFQFLGYETLVKTITVSNGFITLDVTLKPIVYQLKSFNVQGGKEDPSYTVIRKAIAKATFHLNQLDTYSARVYIKGSGRLLDSPILLRKLVEKEGIDSNMAFVSESITDIKYTRPNTYEQTVISMRQSGTDNNSNPTEYIFGSFYQPKLGDAVSPLSPRAFAYYKFRYEGVFTDRGFTINKVRVKPRSKGDDLFDGYIYIIEDLWSIYRVDLTTYKYGIEVKIEQSYNPIIENVWMPVNFKIDVKGKFFGFEFIYNYLATISDYKVELNPDLDFKFEVIDEKIETELAEELDKSAKDKDGFVELGSEKELTRKQIKKLIKEYEKEENKKEDTEDVVSNRNITIDSLASKKDSIYWNSVRTVPLDKYEIRGYKKLDSLLVVQKEKDAKDSLKNNKNFKWYDIFIGGGYNLDDKNHLSITNMLELMNYNTVDGYFLGYRLKYNYEIDDEKDISFAPQARYAFSREAWNYRAVIKYRFGSRGKNGSISADFGRFTRQFNANNPIHPINNSFTTLFLNNNFIKIYERNYIDLHFQKNFTQKYKLIVNTSWSERKELHNTTDFTFINWDSREFTSNSPVNVELADTDFPIHQAFVSDIAFEYKPWLKFRIRNGKKRAIKSSSPTFSVKYIKAIAAGASVIDFDQIDLGVNYRGPIGARGEININLNGGSFLSTSKMYFMDFRHFMGNRSPFSTNDPTKSYRLLPYYFYSTTGNYLTGFVHFQFRKLLLTQFTMVRFAGLKENLFVNYLGTQYSKNYTEIGYGLDNIFRFFRVEAIVSLQDDGTVDYGFRIGVSTVLDFE
jgi:hypothetical protein